MAPGSSPAASARIRPGGSRIGDVTWARIVRGVLARIEFRRIPSRWARTARGGVDFVALGSHYASRAGSPGVRGGSRWVVHGAPSRLLRPFLSAALLHPLLRPFFSYSGGSRGVAEGKGHSRRGRGRARGHRCAWDRHPTRPFHTIGPARLAADAGGPRGRGRTSGRRDPATWKGGRRGMVWAEAVRGGEERVGPVIVEMCIMLSRGAFCTRDVRLKVLVRVQSARLGVLGRVRPPGGRPGSGVIAAAAVRAGARGGAGCPNLLQRPGSCRGARRETLIFRDSSRDRSRRGAPLQQIWTCLRRGAPQEPHAHHFCPVPGLPCHHAAPRPRSGGQTCAPEHVHGAGVLPLGAHLAQVARPSTYTGPGDCAPGPVVSRRTSSYTPSVGSGLVGPEEDSWVIKAGGWPSPPPFPAWTFSNIRREVPGRLRALSKCCCRAGASRARRSG